MITKLIIRGKFMHLRSAAVAAATAIGALAGCAYQPPDAASVSQAPPGSVTIYRDRYGAPHLYAAREEDAFWGLGHALAEDRAEGVLLFYLFLRGELASAFGAGAVGSKPGVTGIEPIDIPDALASDIEIRRWRHLDAARENFSALSAQTQKNMTAFISGFAKYLDEHPDRKPAWAPSLEPALPLAASSFLMMAAGGSDIDPCTPRLGQPSAAAPVLDGSNIWAVAARRTSERAAIFLADSHSPYEFFGTFFYPARINTGTLDAWLLDIAGMPIALFAHSRHFAWGWSEGPRQPSDCIALQTAPSDPQLYEYGGAQIRMEVRPYSIPVRGQAAASGVFEYTRHNGVLCPVIARRGRVAYAVSSAYMDRAGRGVDEFHEMLMARTPSQLKAALQPREIYPANLIIAGADGGIRYIRPGRIPLRATHAPQMIDGNDATQAWRGIHPLADLLQLDDPPQGYLGNSNVSPDMMFDVPVLRPDRYPPDFAFEPGNTGTRQIQLIRRLREGTVSFEVARSLVADAHVPGYEAWNDAFRHALREDATPRDAEFSQFIEQLLAFDGTFVPDSRAALAHALVRQALRDRSPDALRIERSVPLGTALGAQDDKRIRRAMDSAYAELRDRLGGLDRTFGDVFRVGRGDVDAPSRGITLLPLQGDKEGITDFGSLWASVYRLEPDGRRRAVSGTRFPFLVQFTEPIRSESLAANGISDQPRSPHYSDQARSFGAGRLHSNFFSPAELARAIESSETFRTSVP